MSLVKKIDAMRMAANIGCSGVHKDENGNWMPCSTHDEMQRISNRAEPREKKKAVKPSRVNAKRKRVLNGRMKKRMEQAWNELEREADKEWEDLGERGVISIQAIPGGGITSGKQLQQERDFFGPEYVRDNDPDVFTDIESARFRARQLGCIGVSRRISKTGRAVWMPCSNMSDYARVAGATALGRRGQRRNFENAVRTIVRNENRKLRRKVSIYEELYGEIK